MTVDDRYQNQPWLVRMWRRRHYIPIPFAALRAKWHHPEDPWGLIWSIAIGLAQSKMKWHYTLDECEEMWSREDD